MNAGAGPGLVKVAVVQQPPVLLDRDATTKLAVDAVAEAAAAGAGLVVFPETFLPGYPVWIWGLRPGGDFDLTSEIHARLLANSVDLTGDDLAPVQDAAARHGVVVVCGVHEREGSFSRATIYNSLVTIGPDGAVLNRHRKLVPTNPERMVWGQGDASGLRVVDTSFGRLGGLICWENYMPLARYALYAAGCPGLRRVHLGRGRHVAGVDAAHRGRGPVLGARLGLRPERRRRARESFPSRETLFPRAGRVAQPR